MEETSGDSAAAHSVTNEPKLLSEINFTGDVTDIEVSDLYFIIKPRLNLLNTSLNIRKRLGAWCIL